MIRFNPKVRPLLFWSQKVLPLVYDDSLSYYEVLNKVVFKLNELIKFFETTVVEEIQKLVAEYFVEMTYDSTTETITFNIGGSDNE